MPSALWGGQDDADDVVQEVFLELWNRMDSLDINEPTIESYLYKTTYSRALNFLKRYRKVDTSVIEDINELRMSCYISSMGNGEKDMENDDLKKRINQAIGELPDKCREIFVLSYLKDMKNSEIAQMLNVSVRTVEAHIYKALKSYVLAWVSFSYFCCTFLVVRVSVFFTTVVIGHV